YGHVRQYGIRRRSADLFGALTGSERQRQHVGFRVFFRIFDLNLGDTSVGRIEINGNSFDKCRAFDLTRLPPEPPLCLNVPHDAILQTETRLSCEDICPGCLDGQLQSRSMSAGAVIGPSYRWEFKPVKCVWPQGEKVRRIANWREL